MCATINTDENFELKESKIAESSSDGGDNERSGSLESNRVESKFAPTTSYGGLKEDLPQKRKERAAECAGTMKKSRNKAYDDNQGQSVGMENSKYHNSYGMWHQYQCTDFKPRLKLQMGILEACQKKQARIRGAAYSDGNPTSVTSTKTAYPSDRASEKTFQEPTCNLASLLCTNHKFDLDRIKPYTLIPVSHRIIDYTKYKLVVQFEQLMIDPRLNQPNNCSLQTGL